MYYNHKRLDIIPQGITLKMRTDSRSEKNFSLRARETKTRRSCIA